MVPRRCSDATPWDLATATYIAHKTAAGALIVIDVLTWSSGIASKSRRMSSRQLIETPTRPTSPAARSSSAS